MICRVQSKDVMRPDILVGHCARRKARLGKDHGGGVL